ncbi:AAA ATPase-like domain-containing protein [Desulfonema limicola]|uniref:AAA ATPase-like domain-containing protein n=1 Tax=Desulfonema limicola TaxID=45656 RepID=A0A975B3I3_9BACT|nr:AAA family ATPase [Desulfonema limicola]QTA78114.1 AAA ATPase-like domain-containing protein [Desulfonema limicola]
MKKRILYANANYEEIISKNGYFVDKTQYIEKLEMVDNPVFLRPRRFGKSLLCRILECYYNINQEDDFQRLFGHTYIGRNPTPLKNSFFVLHLDFSVVKPTGTIKEIEHSFNHTCNLKMDAMTGLSKKWFKNQVKISMEESASGNLNSIIDFISKHNLPPLYIIIDEYDNFANQLIVSHKDSLYYALTADDSFLKTFFKTMKQGRKTGDIANVFITGVLPITMDDLASGFNVASFITLDPEFENMLGFTQAETDRLLDEIYKDYEISPESRQQVNELIKIHYNGYHFVNPRGEAVYNSTILMYFLNDFTRQEQIPKHLIDMNLRTDLSWVRRLTGADPKYTEEFVDQLAIHNKISYDDRFLVQKFDMRQFFEKSFFPISFFYLGMLTRLDDFHLKLPNLNMRQIFIEYFNELHKIDVSTKYADMMQGFVNNPDLHKLFADYWELYISQLPEAVFQKVNENFYRTTFFELCSRFLSRWFTWNVERSYPQGRTDLEFVGKFHEKFADIRMVIEFKYYSNAEFKKFKTAVRDFKLQDKDTEQIMGYAQGLRQEYPNAQISLYVIYCFGNQGFRVFDVEKYFNKNAIKA